MAQHAPEVAGAMDYRQALDYILAFADYERAPSGRIRYREFRLERVLALLARLKHPEQRFAAVHIAGTKGKGSTAAMTASVLRAAGYRTGLYTSPHLHTMRERIAVDGVPISEEEFASGVEAMQPAVEEVNARGEWGQLTTFELLTALAFYHFRRHGVRQAVIEVGMGGRLDATNVITPAISTITNISLDHTEVLGDTIGKIAAEKAAIIKPGVPVVSGPQPAEALEVITQTAARRHAPLTVVGRDVSWEARGQDLEGQRLLVRSSRGERPLWVPLLGSFQQENVATAVAICDIMADKGLHVPEEAIKAGLAQVSWPGRLEVLARDPLTVVDGAHNPYSMRRLSEAIREVFDFQRVVAIVGVGRGKDIDGMMAELADLPVTLIASQSRNPKAAPAEEVYQAATRHGIPAELVRDPAGAVERARGLAGAQDLILATGSLFVVAEVREAVKGITPELYAASRAAAV